MRSAMWQQGFTAGVLALALQVAAPLMAVLATGSVWTQASHDLAIAQHAVFRVEVDRGSAGTASGTSVIVGTDGPAVTCLHVVEGGQAVTAVFESYPRFSHQAQSQLQARWLGPLSVPGLS